LWCRCRWVVVRCLPWCCGSRCVVVSLWLWFRCVVGLSLCLLWSLCVPWRGLRLADRMGCCGGHGGWRLWWAARRLGGCEGWSLCCRCVIVVVVLSLCFVLPRWSLCCRVGVGCVAGQWRSGGGAVAEHPRGSGRAMAGHWRGSGKALAGQAVAALVGRLGGCGGYLFSLCEAENGRSLGLVWRCAGPHGEFGR
jgi:hypothetical protein